MQLTLQNVIPLPLMTRLAGTQSDIWGRTCVFARGDQLFVQAPSGTGKTTLLHMLYGLRKDFEGDIAWDNDALSSFNPEGMAELRAKDLSIIFQDLRLFPALTALENIEIKRELTDSVTTAQVESWMKRLGIADKKLQKAQTLSYGEQQRVAIIRALVQPFKWLLMDEPFSHLDHENTQKAATLIAEVVAANKAGMLLADLDENHHFAYTRSLKL